MESLWNMELKTSKVQTPLKLKSNPATQISVHEG